MKFNIEKGNFTTTFNDIFNAEINGEKLSPETWGLYIYMLSLPEDWDFSVRGLSKIINAGVNKIQRILKELELTGFISRYQPFENGKFGKIQYTILRQPKKVNKNEISNNKNNKKNIKVITKSKPKKELKKEKNLNSPCTRNPYTENSDTKQSTKEQSIKTDKFKIKGNSFPNSFHFLVKELIVKKIISSLDIKLKDYNSFFYRVDKEYDFETVLEATRYVSDYYLKNKPKLYNKFEWLTESIENNIIKLSKNNSFEINKKINNLLKFKN